MDVRADVDGGSGEAFKNKCYRRMVGISYRKHKINDHGNRSISSLDVRSFNATRNSGWYSSQRQTS